MYSCAGTLTCGGYPSSFDREYIDAQMFADFGVDYLKYDFCNKPRFADGPTLYHRMSLALRATGREILFSACNWGCDAVETWIRGAGAHIYRSTGDINDNFQRMSEVAISQIDKLPYAGPGCFNDIDMLVVGMHNQGNVASGGMTDDEYLFHFALWCVMQSPLMIGCDVRKMGEATLKTLTNKELIRINQDEESRPAFQIDRQEVKSNFLGFKHLENNEYLLFCFNFTDSSGGWRTNFYDFGMTESSGFGLDLTDVITGEKLGVVHDQLNFNLSAHGFKIYRGSLLRC
jgi:alpha-galactosidase